MSAHLPGVIEPMSWSSWKHCAQLMVTIWMAVIASIPRLTAVRTMWSRCPSLTRVCGCASSDTSIAKRESTSCSVMALASVGRSFQAEP